MMRILMLVVVSSIAAVAFGQEEKKPTEKKYEFVDFGTFTTSGGKVTTPAGRQFKVEGGIYEMWQYGDQAYLISNFYIRRYDSTADKDETQADMPFTKVFQYVYRAPAHHEILGFVEWPGTTQRYYILYLRANKELALEQQTIVFRGFVRVYPGKEETYVQYIPYTRLPEEGRWYIAGGSGNKKRMVLTIQNKTTGEERPLLFVRILPDKEAEFSDDPKYLDNEAQ